MGRKRDFIFLLSDDIKRVSPKDALLGLCHLMPFLVINYLRFNNVLIYLGDKMARNFLHDGILLKNGRPKCIVVKIMMTTKAQKTINPNISLPANKIAC